MGDVRISWSCVQCGRYGLCLAGQWIQLFLLLPSSEGLWVIYTQRVGSVEEPKKDSVELGCLLAQGHTYFMTIQNPGFQGGGEAALAIPNSKTRAWIRSMEHLRD